ncbi:hypothetical protein EMCRGX_G002781 [Ephydatia muelleri]
MRTRQDGPQNEDEPAGQDGTMERLQRTSHSSDEDPTPRQCNQASGNTHKASQSTNQGPLSSDCQPGVTPQSINDLGKPLARKRGSATRAAIATALALMAKVDLMSAFRMVPVRPDDWNLLGSIGVAFFGFLRVIKFTVNSWKKKAMRRGRFLAKQDVLLAPYNLQLTIKYSKMDQLGKGSIIAMMGITRSSLLSNPRHAIILKVLSCQASCSIIPLPVWQDAVSPKATVHPPFSVAPEQL